MRPVKDETMDELEQAAALSAKAIKAYLVYQGDNAQYRDKARVAASAISAFARTRASESNRMAIELVAERQRAGLALPASVE